MRTDAMASVMRMADRFSAVNVQLQTVSRGEVKGFSSGPDGVRKAVFRG